jgi:hypothetical protein
MIHLICDQQIFSDPEILSPFSPSGERVRVRGYL